MLGILGGTFDPVHYGHLRPAHEAAAQLALDEVRLIVAANPPHRRAPGAGAAQRLRMVELAVSEFPRFIADDREIRRDGVSYTVPTLESLRADFGPRPLCLLVGSDAFAGIETWHAWQRIPELAHVVVLRRPGARRRDDAALPGWARIAENATQLSRHPAGRLLFLDVTPYDIAATHIRAAIARGERPPADWLPAPVWQYIERHGIYRSPAA